MNARRVLSLFCLTSDNLSCRVCAGRDLANQALFMDIATILWAFDIKKATDATGQPIAPPDGYILDGGVFM